MTDTLLVEGIPVSAEPPAPEPQTQTSGPQEPPQAPSEPPPGDPGGSGNGQPPILETAFVVYMDPQGHWRVIADLHTAAEMQINRSPNVDDFFNGASTILRDIHIQEAASTAVGMLAQSGLVQQSVKAAVEELGEKARQAAMNQQITQALGGGGGIDLSKLGRK